MRTTRRDFLKRSLGATPLLAFTSVVPGFLSRTAMAAAGRLGEEGPVLVVVQLSGGNDGLNTVVPFEDDAYHRNRPTLRLRAEQLHKLEAGLGFHSEMGAFHRLYESGHLSVIQGVGYPNSNRDHEGAMRDWHSARPGESARQTGWVGRAVDQAFTVDGLGLPGVFVGQIKPPFSVRSETALVPSVASSRPWVLDGFAEPVARLAAVARAGANNSLLEFVQKETLAAYACNQRIQEVLKAGSRPGAKEYPQLPLARTLRSIAELIRAGLGARIYFAELGGGEIGGFDTHAGQAANHGALLRELSDSVAAFVEDLGRDGLLNSVLVMTFSEFGRGLSENGRRGTGHGSAAPMFIAGGKLQRRLVGAHPSLTDLEDDAPKFHTDFRRVYATVLEQWLGFDSKRILGKNYELVDGLFG
jgi:uncharacterized protein (DUF1501 family)